MEEEEEEEEDEPKKADNDSEKGGTEELVTSESDFSRSPGSPGFHYGNDSYEMFAKPRDSNSDGDDLVLGVRIYTQGGAVVSVTGQVVRDEIIEEDEDDNAAKAKEDDKKEVKEAKKAKDKKKKQHIPIMITQSSNYESL